MFKKSNFAPFKNESDHEKTGTSLRKKFSQSLDNFSKAIKNKFSNIKNNHNEKIKIVGKSKIGSKPNFALLGDFSSNTLTEKDSNYEIPAKQSGIDENRRKLYLEGLVNGTSQLSTYFTRNYKLGDLIGDGSCGFVFTAKKISNDREVAVKFILRSRTAVDSWVTDGDEKIPLEIAILKALDHPYIIKYIEHIFEKEYVLLVTDIHGTSWDASNIALNPEEHPGIKFKYRPKNILAKGENIRARTSYDLFECIDARTIILLSLDDMILSKNCKLIFAQIVLACEYLLENNIVHRDIKDENIVVGVNYDIKMIDFGSAAYVPKLEKDWFSAYKGTPNFSP
jgi:serine/threonine protein kinase